MPALRRSVEKCKVRTGRSLHLAPQKSKPFQPRHRATEVVRSRYQRAGLAQLLVALFLRRGQSAVRALQFEANQFAGLAKKKIRTAFADAKRSCRSALELRPRIILIRRASHIAIRRRLSRR
jgi:hypothetical protein